MDTTPTTEDRVWAVLSHLSALAFGMGILLPIIGWSEQRRKSKYASFQCLQALGYQSLGYTVWILSYLVLMILFMILLVALSGFDAGSGNNLDGFMGMGMIVFLFILFGVFGIYFLLPCIAAIACAFGMDFKYPILGNRLAKYLGYEYKQDEVDQLIEEHEGRWVAAMGHFSVIIALWGILAPITAWIVQGKHSAFIKFQSAQTVIFQLIINVLYMGSGVVAFISVVPLMVTTGFGGGQNSDIPTMGLIFFFIFMLISLVVILFLPLFHILGQWAGYRVLKGYDYRYPLVGRLVEKWLVNKTSLTAVNGGSSLQTPVKEKTS